MSEELYEEISSLLENELLNNFDSGVEFRISDRAILYTGCEIWPYK